MDPVINYFIIPVLKDLVAVLVFFLLSCLITPFLFFLYILCEEICNRRSGTASTQSQTQLPERNQSMSKIQAIHHQKKGDTEDICK